MVKRKSKTSKAVQALLGRWDAFDPWATDISLIISNRGGKIRVRAVDQTDGEKAEIFGLKTTRVGLSFAAYWSSGQFTKYRLRAMRADELEVIFTFTRTETFKKVSVKR